MLGEIDTIPLDTSNLIINKCKSAYDVITYCLDIGYSLKKACKLAYKYYQIDHKEYFDGRYILKYIKTFEHVCYVLNIKPDSILIEGLTDNEIAGRKLKLIIKILNNGWVKDWSNPIEYYFIPYFVLKNGSFVYHYYSKTVPVMNGMGFKNKELMFHAVKYWLEEYIIYIKGK